MTKKILALLSALFLLGVSGCSYFTTTTNTAATTQASAIKQILQAEIAEQWAVKQVEINLQSGTSIMLILADGDTVEGYFYLLKGAKVGFQIYGESLIYESRPDYAVSENISSDRFSFTATNAQGIAYTLKFTPDEVAGEAQPATVFLEVVYPVNGEIFYPAGTK